MHNYNKQQQAVILKGIAQQILSMNVPTIDELDKLLQYFEYHVVADSIMKELIEKEQYLDSHSICNVRPVYSEAYIANLVSGVLDILGDKTTPREVQAISDLIDEVERMWKGKKSRKLYSAPETMVTNSQEDKTLSKWENNTIGNAFKRSEVVTILVSLFMFFNSDKTTDIEGLNYGEKAESVINSYLATVGTERSVLSIISGFKKKQ